MKKLTALLLTATMCLALTACGSKTGGTSSASSTPEDTKTYTIKLAMQQGDVDRESSAEVTWVERFKEEVEKNSNGRINVEIYPSAQLGSQEDNIASLLNNSLEMTVVNITLLNSISPETMLLSCPALFANEEQCDAVLAGEWGQKFWSDVADQAGVRVLAAFCNGMRSFTAKTPLTTVESAKGITFRVMTSEVCEKMVEAIGANPVPMPGSEMYTALQNGTVDGQENPPVNKVLLVITVLASAFTLLLQVVYRFILIRFVSFSCTWTNELAQDLIVWMTYLAVGICYKENSMASVNLIYDRLKPRGKVILYLVTRVLVFVFLVVGLKYGWAAIQSVGNWTSPSLHLPGYLLHGAPFLGCVFIAYEALVDVLGVLCGELVPFVCRQPHEEEVELTDDEKRILAGMEKELRADAANDQ